MRSQVASLCDDAKVLIFGRVFAQSGGEGVDAGAVGEGFACADADAAVRTAGIEVSEFDALAQAARNVAGECGEEGVALTGGDEVFEGFETGGDEARGRAAAT